MLRRGGLPFVRVGEGQGGPGRGHRASWSGRPGPGQRGNGGPRRGTGADEWETDDAGYSASLRDATFMVTGGPAQLPGARSAALCTFGRPERTYSYDGYTIMVWDTNLLLRLGHPGIV